MAERNVLRRHSLIEDIKLVLILDTEMKEVINKKDQAKKRSELEVQETQLRNKILESFLGRNDDVSKYTKEEVCKFFQSKLLDIILYKSDEQYSFHGTYSLSSNNFFLHKFRCIIGKLDDERFYSGLIAALYNYTVEEDFYKIFTTKEKENFELLRKNLIEMIQIDIEKKLSNAKEKFLQFQTMPQKLTLEEILRGENCFDSIRGVISSIESWKIQINRLEQAKFCIENSEVVKEAPKSSLTVTSNSMNTELAKHS